MASSDHRDRIIFHPYDVQTHESYRVTRARSRTMRHSWLCVAVPYSTSRSRLQTRRQRCRQSGKGVRTSAT